MTSAERARAFSELVEYFEAAGMRPGGLEEAALQKLRRAHKQLYAVLVWRANIGRLGRKGLAGDDASIAAEHLKEAASDLIQATLLIVLGCYKPAAMMTRSAVENVLRCVGASDGQKVSGISQVRELMEVLERTETVCKNQRTQTHFRALRKAYRDLSVIVHGRTDENASLVDALRRLPGFEEVQFNAVVGLLSEAAKNGNAILAYCFTDTLSRMDYRHKDPILEALAPSDRRRVQGEGQQP